MTLQPRGGHRARSPSLQRQARDCGRIGLRKNRTGTDSDQEVQQARAGKEIQVKAPMADEITDLMEELMRTSTRPTVRDKEREEDQRK